MIEIYCDRCLDALDRPGGLLSSPPDDDYNVVKYHLCTTCFKSVLAIIKQRD